MTEKERLIELIKEARERYIYAEEIAQYLTGNDVVSVVRCKDCKWWMDETCINVNGAKGFIPNGNWFCCSGKRKVQKGV